MQGKPEQVRLVPIADIRKVIDRFVAAYKAGNAARMAAVLTETAVLIPPGEPPITGVDKIRSRFQSFFDGFHFYIDFQPVQTELMGSVGFERGTYSASAVIKGGQEPRGGHGEYILLLELQPDRRWLISAFGTASPGDAIPPDTVDTLVKKNTAGPW